MDKILIQGPCRLSGKVRASGAKNAVLPEMAAFLMLDGPVTLRNVPSVRDVSTMGLVLRHLGIRDLVLEGGVLSASGCEPKEPEAPYNLVRQMRASILVLGPLLARLGRAKVSLPGGCAIGARPIDLHIEALRRMGARVVIEHGYVLAECPRLRGAEIEFAKPTVTGTENIMMAAALAEGRTVLRNCALEPEIGDLAAFLNGCGAKISGAGTGAITIDGVTRLRGSEHRAIPDRIEAGTFLIAAAATGGEVTVEGAEPEHLAALLEVLRAAGARVELHPGGSQPDERRTSMTVVPTGPLRATSVTTLPHPAFPTDLQAQLMALLTAASGVSTVTETVFENRFMHVGELRRMGARIEVVGETATVTGPTPLSGAPVMASDLRASACLIVAGLLAEGETLIDRAYHIDRGYEQVVQKFRNLGARIDRIRN
ncbi:MAG TPA: UDP-N-acetylglucosamine 1-carboxyvinyltransferase [Candidatus Polarisedimenticolia bacterium]|jgi:UDP-N-acetylglucosamine 1-carboxyvinyltransferase|nr:UDP-N-acetylglucosamine 1-carboxyvinyltransferase [Candidatus Polarisedimenticolia bacterium]